MPTLREYYCLESSFLSVLDPLLRMLVWITYGIRFTTNRYVVVSGVDSEDILHGY